MIRNKKIDTATIVSSGETNDELVARLIHMANHTGSITALCKELRISRSLYYNRTRAQGTIEPELAIRINHLYRGYFWDFL